ncbi:DUF427 domain-containing protein [Methanohalophilus portucalensis]|jgi:uncharacterized protein (DUF427 family)|uniref:DUF427 domain-containing protein n=2 Tax=Methanohalophilus portucalensis TaxID=39664 RepID=A0A1L9C5E2_9EURY|nr:DUF427 domain-containing protein [Methanohalophilus portucalensis]ATU08306.1 hypothetical protein BKM01_05690 [Methanohalophilus portucalensis]OJH49628.1 hypothetical protein MPF_0416 [Methanohalophilus portucalensis FDF-1]RNI13529.1 DUF427 domain-containing protein [Methanohalophilus portucalensis FDF-1]SMH35032.1 Nucleotidyltransferase [Methanohalophilus portucalensis FDF-1]
MPVAKYKGVVLADSNATEKVEGNHYFPPESVNMEYFRDSDTVTVCPWKGKASYYDIVLEDSTLKDGAWNYPQPKPAASNIKGYLAFDTRGGVEITD